MAGRPAYKITPELCKQVEQLAAQGLTEKEICLCIGWHQDTLIKKKRAFTEFAESLKRGKAKGNAQITNALFNNARNGNVTAQIFYLKNRAGWKDKVESNITGDGITFNLNYGDADAN